MIYANGVEVVHGNTPDWRGGTIFYGSEGTIWVDRGPWKSDPENLIKDYKATVSLRQPKNHHDDWLDCIHNGQLPLAHAEAGHNACPVPYRHISASFAISDTNYAVNSPGILRRKFLLETRKQINLPIVNAAKSGTAFSFSAQTVLYPCS